MLNLSSLDLEDALIQVRCRVRSADEKEYLARYYDQLPLREATGKSTIGEIPIFFRSARAHRLKPWLRRVCPWICSVLIEAGHKLGIPEYDKGW